MWVPDTAQKVNDAATSLVTRLKQHLGSQAHADVLSDTMYEETLKGCEIVVKEWEEDEPVAPPIIRNRRMDEPPQGSLLDEAPPREPPQAQPLVSLQQQQNPRWPGNKSSSSAGLPVVGSAGMEGMNMERARRYLATLGTSELRDMVRLVMDEFQQRESRGV